MPRHDRLVDYQQNVFLNCPFDIQYKPLFEALAFTVMACGFRIRCALEIENGAEVRIHKILRVIEECQLGIHDLSRTELNETGLPRFNMPLELGMFMGAKQFGDGRQRSKTCLILDRERYRYQIFISDIAGQDIRSHENSVDSLIVAVRGWLAQVVRVPPGPEAIRRHYRTFQQQLPEIGDALHIRVDEMTFSDLINAITSWLAEHPLRIQRDDIA